jgi:pimeloyl-ACP methyl ester carboxylesterase
VAAPDNSTFSRSQKAKTANVDPVRRTHSSQKQAPTTTGSPRAVARSAPQQQCATLSRAASAEALISVSALALRPDALAAAFGCQFRLAPGRPLARSGVPNLSPLHVRLLWVSAEFTLDPATGDTAIARRPRHRAGGEVNHAQATTESAMSEITHRTVDTNGIRMHLAEAGEGPLVVMCHGFPESWYSWRHQLRAVADAGFHAVAPDMRGYGQTDAPAAIDQYTLLDLIGDMLGLLDALGAEHAVIAGHDWGAPVAWQAARLRPDRFRGVVGLSVPFSPRGTARPTTVMPQTEDAMFYQLYFQTPGVAETEHERDVRTTFRKILYSISGNAPERPVGMVPRQGGFLTRMADPPALPSWLSEADIDFYVSEFTRTGFRGGLNWYRNIDRNWELLAAFSGVPVTVPALYIAGDRDPVVRFPGMDRLLPNLVNFVPQLRATMMLPGCGHWTQQERPDEVNAAMIDFLRGLP